MFSRETHFLEFPNAFDLLHPPFNSSEQSKSTKKILGTFARTEHDATRSVIELSAVRERKNGNAFFSPYFSIFLVACSFKFILWLIGVSYHILMLSTIFFSSNPCSICFSLRPFLDGEERRRRFTWSDTCRAQSNIHFFFPFSSRRALAVSLCWAKCKCNLKLEYRRR